jgi:uncharacterized membrane protein
LEQNFASSLSLLPQFWQYIEITPFTIDKIILYSIENLKIKINFLSVVNWCIMFQWRKTFSCYLVTEITEILIIFAIIGCQIEMLEGCKDMNAFLMYGLSIVLLAVSYFKDKKKTKMAIKKGWKSFLNILPQMLGIVTMVGFIFAFFNAETISRLVGNESGWLGVVISAIVGAITLIPGFVAFPTAALVLQNGGGYMQIGAFISTLMMVGVMTAPLEIKYFGKKMTIIRNTLAFLFSFVVALVIGMVMS